MEQFLKADDNRCKKIEVNSKNLEDFLDEELTRKDEEDKNAKEEDEKKQQELEAEVWILVQSAKK